MKKNVLLGVVVVVALFAGVYFFYAYLSENYTPESNIVNTGAQNGTEKKTEETVKEKAQNFTVYDQDGNSVELCDFFGKPIVLNFWASWCSECKSEMPNFEEAYKNNIDIEFLMVDMTAGSNETLSKAQNFIWDKGYTFPVYYDKDGQAQSLYGVYAIPMTVLIGRDGTIIGQVIGSLSADSLDQLLDMARTGEMKEFE